MLARKDAWVQHPIFGEASFDAFVHAPNNPVCRGAPPYDWPVNGFLFEDPVRGHWYLYVGLYHRGYEQTPDRVAAKCVVYRSEDRGQSWNPTGPVFDDDGFTFRGDAHAAANAPDVTVVWHGGRYHLVYDWATINCTWQSFLRLRQRPDGADSGLGYAWSDTPEGPFHRVSEPIFRNSAMPNREPFIKYHRIYGGSLVRRAHDWLVLGALDSHTHKAWAMAGMAAPNPDGPYTEPRLLLSAESDRYHHSMLEYYPAFVQDGWVYAPANALGINRNFQTIHRAPLERALDPDAWELFQHGSVWHADDVENESRGMFGQTITGFVDRAGQFQVMFSSADPKLFGTINLASRPWNRPYRDRGFHLSGSTDASLTRLRRTHDAFRLEAEFALRGSLAILWAHRAPYGLNKVWSQPPWNPRMRTRYQSLELEPGAWRIVQVDEKGGRAVAASGTLPPAKRRQVIIDRGADGTTAVTLDGAALWEGPLAAGAGALGLAVGTDSHLFVERFAVSGIAADGALSLLAIEAVMGAANRYEDWEHIESDAFRFGLGAVHKAAGGRAKWNFQGTGFALWSPCGPEYGAVEVLVDGRPVGTVDLHAAAPARSEVVLRRTGLNDGLHAVVLLGRSGRLVLDSLDALTAV